MKKAAAVTLIVIVIILGCIIFVFWKGSVFSKEMLRLEVLGPATAHAGEEITYSVKYKNNGNLVLENPKLVFELPENSLTENSKLRFTQDLEDIYPGQEESVQFKGRILGKEGDVALAHAWLSYNPHNLSARYESKTILTTRIDLVPITLTYKINSKIERGGPLSYSIYYVSKIDYPLENLSIKVNPTDGFKITSAEPASLNNVEWKLDTLNRFNSGQIKINGTVTDDAPNQLDFSFKLGMWHDGSFTVLAEERKEVALSSNSQPAAEFKLSQKGFYRTLGEIENSGPIPPKVGETTTYSISWEVKSDNTDLRNLNVSAILPENVSLRDNLFPEAEAAQFSFDNETRQVTWLVPNLAAGASTFLTFQVGLTPHEAQKDTLAELIGKATLLAEAQHGGSFEKTAPGIATNLPDDQINSGGGVVR